MSVALLQVRKDKINELEFRLSHLSAVNEIYKQSFEQMKRLHKERYCDMYVIIEETELKLADEKGEGK